MIVVHRDIEQSSDAWHRLRLGIATASRFEDVIGRRKDGKYRDGRRNYLLEKAGEVITGEIPENFGGNALARGKGMEAEGRDVYQFLTGNTCEQVSFVARQMPWGVIGCSPDSFVTPDSIARGHDGLLEIKTKKAALQLDVLDADKIPAEHYAQLQGALLVSGRPWIDLCCYWPKIKPFIRRVERDERYIAELVVELESFYSELNALVEKHRD